MRTARAAPSSAAAPARSSVAQRHHLGHHVGQRPNVIGLRNWWTGTVAVRSASCWNARCGRPSDAECQRPHVRMAAAPSIRSMQIGAVADVQQHDRGQGYGAAVPRCSGSISRCAPAGAHLTSRMPSAPGSTIRSSAGPAHARAAASARADGLRDSRQPAACSASERGLAACRARHDHGSAVSLDGGAAARGRPGAERPWTALPGSPPQWCHRHLDRAVERGDPVPARTSPSAQKSKIWPPP